MATNKINKVQKRNGEIVDFDEVRRRVIKIEKHQQNKHF